MEIVDAVTIIVSVTAVIVASWQATEAKKTLKESKKSNKIEEKNFEESSADEQHTIKIDQASLDAQREISKNLAEINATLTELLKKN